ncbi:MAG: hypothetical protein ACI865_001819 [Flavobacteriaceae bacterium]
MSKTHNYRLNTICFKGGEEKGWIPTIDNFSKSQPLKTKIPVIQSITGFLLPSILVEEEVLTSED